MDIYITGIILVSFIMVISRRLKTIIYSFSFQSFLLFLLTLSTAYKTGSAELYVVSFFLLALKAIMIPLFLYKIKKKLEIGGNPGFYLNPFLSLFAAILLTYFAYVFVGRVIPIEDKTRELSFIVSLSVILMGLFLMIFRIKAIAQVIGLLVLENGLFLSAVSLCEGMPFFVEIAIFFDVFVCALILGIFIYRINELFTHIDINKLTQLKG